MDTVKIENFVREYPDKRFPTYRSLSVQDTGKLVDIVKNRLGIPHNSSPLDLVKKLRDRSFVIPDTCADSIGFDLKSTILGAGISPNKTVLVNWYRFDRIDEMDLSDLSTHFNEIWYPAVDDIDIFDNTFGWIISISYSGEVMMLIFDNYDPD